jgi:two-component system, NtrC family, response regulator HydG
MVSILIIEDDVAFSAMLKTFFEKRDYKVQSAMTAEDGYKKLSSNSIDIVLTDVRLPDSDGIEILQEVKKNYPRIQVIVMTNYAEINMAVKAMKHGAFDYVSKPFQPETILQTIQNALNQNEVKNEENSTPVNTSKPAREKSVLSSEFVKGVSDPARKLNDYIDLVAPTNMSVLIIGESGTGKEQVAKSIHDKSKRKGAPFIAVDCGAIPKEIASSEFFGHIKGSFTGAIQDKTGHFEAANGGTFSWMR